MSRAVGRVLRRAAHKLNFFSGYQKRQKHDFRVFSGIQPTGGLTLGNYLGAVKNWVTLQEKHPTQVIYSIVDLHSLTTYTGPDLHEKTFDMAVNLLACGIDPEKAILYKQSSNPAHSELTWLLSCITPIGFLNRMTQYKEKKTSSPLLGLLAYPVLMSADVLLFKATHVPVGQDQSQHLELARTLAQLMNNRVQTDLFPQPEVLLTPVPKIYSLRNGKKKMSKSDPSDKSRINLTDTPDEIKVKIKKAKTDSQEYVFFDEENRPEVSNLMKILSIFKNEDTAFQQFCKEIADAKMTGADLKEELTTALIAGLDPIRDRIENLRGRPAYVREVLEEGSKRARAISEPVLEETKALLGVGRLP